MEEVTRRRNAPGVVQIRTQFECRSKREVLEEDRVPGSALPCSSRAARCRWQSRSYRHNVRSIDRFESIVPRSTISPTPLSHFIQIQRILATFERLSYRVGALVFNVLARTTATESSSNMSRLSASAAPTTPPTTQRTSTGTRPTTTYTRDAL